MFIVVAAAMVVGVGVTLLLTNGSGPGLIAEITAVHKIDASTVAVSWRVRNKGNEGGHFGRCTIQLGGLTPRSVSGSWVGGPSGNAPARNQWKTTTIVRVTSGSSGAVTVDGTSVMCTEQVAEQGG